MSAAARIRFWWDASSGESEPEVSRPLAAGSGGPSLVFRGNFGMIAEDLGCRVLRASAAARVHSGSRNCALRDDSTIKLQIR